MMTRILPYLAPVRWLRSVQGLMKGARISPSAMLFGHVSRVRLGKGSKIGARCRLDVGTKGLIEIGESVWIASDIEIQTNSSVAIGATTTVQRRCTINGTVRLGAGCILAPDVFISSGTHPFRVIPALPIREQERVMADDPATAAALDRPIWIQDDCWLGVHTVICPGVTIGKGSVVGANSVVVRDVPPYTVVAGTPAKEIGKRLEWLPPAIIDIANEQDHPYLLLATVRRDSAGRPRYAEITLNTPLIGALSAQRSSGGIQAKYQATRAAVLQIGAREYAIAAGEGHITIEPTGLKVVDDVAYCEIRALSDAQPVLITRLMGLSRA